MRHCGIFVLCFLLTGFLSAQDSTLGDLLKERGIPLLADPQITLNEPLATPESPLDNEQEFALAYRFVKPDGLLYGPIQFVRYNKRNGTLATLNVGTPTFLFEKGVEPACDGAVEGVEHELGHYFIRVHLTPSAVCTIVLAEAAEGTFQVETVLNGWVDVFMKPQTVIYSGRMVHFADVHPETLWTYDVRTKKTFQLYPQPNDPLREAFSTKLEKIIDQGRCRENNWGCEPDRFSSTIGFPLVWDQEERVIAFNVIFDSEGFMGRDEAENSGLFDDDEYVYFFQLQPFRWRELSIYDLKPKFGTDNLFELLSPAMLKKVFATPAPN